MSMCTRELVLKICHNYENLTPDEMVALLDCERPMTSEDAQELARGILDAWGIGYDPKNRYTPSREREAVALIEADRARVLKEAVDRVRTDFHATEGHSYTIDRVCAAILGGRL